MSQKKSITAATELPCEFVEALNKWRMLASDTAAFKDIRWYSKNTSTEFVYGGNNYKIQAEDIFCDAFLKKYAYGFLCARFEQLQPEISSDLKCLGAVNITEYGDID